MIQIVPIWEAKLESQTPQFRYAGHDGYTVERSTAAQYVFIGDASLRLQTPTGIQYKKASISKFLPFISSQPVAVDLWFQIPDLRELGLELSLDSWDGQARHMASFQWIYSREYGGFKGWRIWGPESVAAYGNWVYVPEGEGVDVSRGWYQWHHLLAVVDFGKREYVSLTVDDVDFNLARLGYEIQAQSNEGGMLAPALMVWCQTPNGAEVDLGAFTIGVVDG
jgi:hypothetical protein